MASVMLLRSVLPVLGLRSIQIAPIFSIILLMIGYLLHSFLMVKRILMPNKSNEPIIYIRSQLLVCGAAIITQLCTSSVMLALSNSHFLNLNQAVYMLI